ncbi:MAG: acetate--CoA ligase family protein [Alphaproteobacteria bacterium]
MTTDPPPADTAAPGPDDAPAPAAATDALRIIDRWRTFAGIAHGQSQPVIEAAIRIACPRGLDLHALGRLLAGLVDAPAWQLPDRPDRNLALADMLLRWAIALQAWSGHPIQDSGSVAPIPAGGRRAYRLVMPYDDAVSGRFALDSAGRLINRIAATDPAGWAALAPSLRDEVASAVTLLRSHAPSNVNTVRLLQAARAQDVPWLRLAAHVYQIGQGARARRLDSTLTDSTPAIGMSLARNKRSTAMLLRAAGMPAPEHRLARSEDEAVRIAGQLGYPVVVKPIDLDGGHGVAAGLIDAPSVRAAFRAVAALARRALVEKHVDGEDFRLLVIGGKVAIAVTRQPGGVTGDGVRTVAALLDAVNADPRRSTRPGAILKPIPWNDEAAALLAEQGLSRDDVPAHGRFVRLRRTANMATGGMPVLATDRVHPENIRLAERAAALFRLDIAGIDFITPDVGRPWHEVDAVINEVNAQPSFGVVTSAHLYGEIVRWMTGGGTGRIPIAAIIGGPKGEGASVAAIAHEMLLASGVRSGLATRSGAWVGDERIGWTDMSGERGGRALLVDARVEAMVLEATRKGMRETGLPFDACDLVAVLDADGTGIEDELLGRARQAIVVPPAVAVAAAARRPGCRVILAAGGTRDARIDACLADGGGALWLEPAGEATTLCIAEGDAPIHRITSPGAVGPGAVVAAGIAHAMGCPPAAIAGALAARAGTTPRA